MACSYSNTDVCEFPSKPSRQKNDISSIFNVTNNAIGTTRRFICIETNSSDCIAKSPQAFRGFLVERMSNFLFLGGLYLRERTFLPVE
jgi:hypothetical protein